MKVGSEVSQKYSTLRLVQKHVGGVRRNERCGFSNIRFLLFREVIKMMEQQYSGKLDRMGYLTMMMMDEERREQMGEEVYEIMVSIFERVQEAIADALNITEVDDA
eukprot:2745477-Amphidinium_carterae.1